ncbi:MULTISPECIES: type II toxin-antitoxin system VapB family antitoxin [unclassified Mycobacterium]|uniref:type II toxin-antitoxin system VapB family antitoxin n=1 Tax=unclassified Mycobacterium TaxID=2642494 RepID=UPI000FB99A9B|nr:MULTISPECIES: type II toxin-antitoxin system VapB family antitoxin [unclassified Mycobacterium]MDP7703932.1 type II toxin-antitoxin system VapB family antitoxin [Mycobacterium sp. TY815]MDP7722414.1 type II toxin-antitoxin system VapB family antitoxin [Mycobacterium sp. TY814]RUP03838.1 MAG: type II toxin-antitoxin system VapB family antitoxin [Mycobacterium sp.]
MLKRVEILLDLDLVDEIIRRYHVADAREAVNLAMRAMLDEADNADPESHDDDFDEFSDLSAWSLHREGDTG